MTEEAPPTKKKKRKKAAATVAPRVSSKARQGKSFVGWAAFLSLVGLALVGTGEATVGPFVVVGAAAIFVYGAHLLGRAGPDEGIFPRQ